MPTPPPVLSNPRLSNGHLPPARTPGPHRTQGHRPHDARIPRKQFPKRHAQRSTTHPLPLPGPPRRVSKNRHADRLSHPAHQNLRSPPLRRRQLYQNRLFQPHATPLRLPQRRESAQRHRDQDALRRVPPGRLRPRHHGALPAIGPPRRGPRRHRTGAALLRRLRHARARRRRGGPGAPAPRRSHHGLLPQGVAAEPAPAHARRAGPSCATRGPLAEVCALRGGHGGCVEPEAGVAVVGYAAEEMLLLGVLGYVAAWGDGCLICVQ